MNWIGKISLLILLSVVVEGCNTYRYLPSHGGGKRFDEEERAVSASIRNAVAQVDIQCLIGHKANVTVLTLAHNGGGAVNLPGFNSASASYSQNSMNYNYAPYAYLHNQDSWNLSLGYQPNTTAWPTVFGTDQDLAYLEAALQMRLRVDGSTVAAPDPEYILYVLVDVLGTNRSKEDSFIVWRDVLTASCELTYYIVDTKTAKVVSGAKRASAEASYCESSIFGLAGYTARRSLYKTVPNPMPTDGNDPVIISYHTIKTTMQQKIQQDEVQYSDPLAAKLQQAQSQLNAGNWQAAEKLLMEIRSANSNYPGVAALASRVEFEKAKAKPATPSPTPTSTAAPSPAPAAVPVPTPAPTPNSAPKSDPNAAKVAASSSAPVSAPNTPPAPAPVTPATVLKPDPNAVKAAVAVSAPEPNSIKR